MSSTTSESSWSGRPNLYLKRQKTLESFRVKSSIYQTHTAEHAGPFQIIYLGIAISMDPRNPADLTIGISAHDGTYSIDYSTYQFEAKISPNFSCPTSEPGSRSTTPVNYKGMDLADFIICKIEEYRKAHDYKIAGAGVCSEAAKLCPELSRRLWLQLDIVSFILTPFLEDLGRQRSQDADLVGEASDDVARQTVRFFGPHNQPRVQLRYPNEVAVDCGGKASIADLKAFKKSVHRHTWKATKHFANSLSANKTKIAFFNSTPQGGGVALMRHALIRFLRTINIDAKWYVPRAKPEVFRITKNNHNILQGVDTTGARLDAASIHELDEWCRDNATRYWTTFGGPLAARSDGGADVIIVDDPQMPMLVEIAKRLDPERPVIFRSHIQVRADLANDQSTPTAEVWNWVWNHVQNCDVFISHPVPEFIPANVTRSKVGYMPATTDWLDGLNKHMDTWDIGYYMHEFFVLCTKHNMSRLDYGKRKYIVQIARFDPAKGIPHVLASYACLRRDYLAHETDLSKIPQLVIAGHGAIDDPDATTIYDQTIKSINDNYPDLKHDIIVMRVGPTDQLLNALMSQAHVALQLSTREGFEVKVSEALHHGVPIIATRVGGIPLQVRHEQNGFLVEPGEPEAVGRQVAKYLFHLFSDEEEYERCAVYAQDHVSDEVSTVGNALAWLYLVDRLKAGEKLRLDCRWVNDLAREAAGVGFDEEWETRLDRDGVEGMD